MTFHCHEGAAEAVAEASAQLNLRFWGTKQQVATELLESPRRRGRPKKTDVPPTGVRVYRARLTLDRCLDEEIERERRRQSTFILITNDEQRSAKDLFLAYRGQASVEAAFRWLKGPVRVSRRFFKKPERVEAFGYVVLMAYLVYALVQRAIRRALPASEKLKVEGRKTDRPTAQVVLDVIAHAKVLHVLVPGERCRRIFLVPSTKIRRIMELLEIPADAFFTLPQANSS